MTASAPAGKRPRPHGRAKYLAEGCRCAVCRKACSDYESRRRKQRAYGRPAYVDATPVRAHLHALSAQGIGWKRAAELAKLATSTVGKILYGHPARGQAPCRKVRPATAQAILAVVPTLDTLPETVLVPALGTQRRLQALVALGYAQAELARRIGVDPANFSALLQRESVLAGTARTVIDLYEQLWDTPPPEQTHRQRISASRARNHARARGWAPPMAWDDDTLDDPAASPELGAAPDPDAVDPVVVERHLAGQPTGCRLTHAERLAIAERVRASGGNATTLAKVLRCNGTDARRLLTG